MNRDCEIVTGPTENLCQVLNFHTGLKHWACFIPDTLAQTKTEESDPITQNGHFS